MQDKNNTVAAKLKKEEKKSMQNFTSILVDFKKSRENKTHIRDSYPFSNKGRKGYKETKG